jgi:hypothetical protein
MTKERNPKMKTRIAERAFHCPNAAQRPYRACGFARRLEETGRSRDFAHEYFTIAELERKLRSVTVSLDLLCEGCAH